MDHAEFEESGFLDVLSGFVLRRLRKTRQLNHNVVEADRLNDRLGHAEIIHPMPQHFGRLRNQAQALVRPHGCLIAIGVHVDHVVGVKADQKLGAALKVQAQLDFARGFLLQCIQDRISGMLIGACIDVGEIRPDIIGADRRHQVAKLPLRLGIGLFQRFSLGHHACEVGINLDRIGLVLENLNQIAAGRRIDFPERPGDEKGDK